MKLMIIALFIFGLLTVIFLSGKLNIHRQFIKEVKSLLSSPDNLAQKFSYDQLKDLPIPVARYFKHVLKEGQPYISTVKLTHDGLFKTGLKKDWINIEGEQYFTTSPPGFIWKGSTRLFTARDMYIHDRGKLVVNILSLVRVVNASGESYDEAELQRWLAECVWFPTNLLPRKDITWEVIDNNHAKLLFRYNKISISYVVTFNEVGEITQLETTRFMEKDKRETWIGTLWDYKEYNGILIPATIEVKWVIGEEHLPYARFHVKTIEYNLPSVPAED